MKLFNTLLEIKTGKKDLALKAVFIEDSLYGWEGAYYIYHYDIENNTFYINDLDYPWTENRISAINIAEQIITKAYKYFQSYSTVVAKKRLKDGQIFLDKNHWNYSRTTARYRNCFLREGIADTRKKIESGEYKLVNLNKPE